MIEIGQRYQHLSEPRNCNRRWLVDVFAMAAILFYGGWRIA